MCIELDFNAIIFLLMVSLKLGISRTRRRPDFVAVPAAARRRRRWRQAVWSDSGRSASQCCSDKGRRRDERRGVAGTQRAASLERHQSAFCPEPQTLQSFGPMPCAQLVHMHTHVNTHKHSSNPCFEKAWARTGVNPKTAFNRPLPVEPNSPPRAAINILCGCVPAQLTYSVCMWVCMCVTSVKLICLVHVHSFWSDRQDQCDKIYLSCLVIVSCYSVLL